VTASWWVVATDWWVVASEHVFSFVGGIVVGFELSSRYRVTKRTDQPDRRVSDRQEDP
jgi:hypothetical protein